jgi:hypothetical protein
MLKEPAVIINCMPLPDLFTDLQIPADVSRVVSSVVQVARLTDNLAYA